MMYVHVTTIHRCECFCQLRQSMAMNVGT